MTPFHKQESFQTKITSQAEKMTGGKTLIYLLNISVFKRMCHVAKPFNKIEQIQSTGVKNAAF